MDAGRIDRGHGEIGFFLCQFLAGHGPDGDSVRVPAAKTRSRFILSSSTDNSLPKTKSVPLRGSSYRVRKLKSRCTQIWKSLVTNVILLTYCGNLWRALCVAVRDNRSATGHLVRADSHWSVHLLRQLHGLLWGRPGVEVPSGFSEYSA